MLEGIHHVTAITGDAPGNVDFYARLLGLRLVKKSVNQDDPTVYHLFYADEEGGAGSDLTFFEYPNARAGQAGTGMIHLVVSRVASEDALDFWERRLSDNGVATERSVGSLRFENKEGMGHEFAVVETDDAPLIAEHPEIPPDMAIHGFDGVRAYTDDPERSRKLFEETLGFVRDAGDDGAWEVRGESRGSFYAYDQAPAEKGIQGAGSVHHVAWASPSEEHADWRKRVLDAGAHATPIIDRFYFRSIYFREPSGVLFEIATLGPGFAVDEDPEHLGEKISLPPALEHYRSEVERLLTPLENPRSRITSG